MASLQMTIFGDLMARNRRTSLARSNRPRRRYEWARSSDVLPLSNEGAGGYAVDLLEDFQSVLGADAAGTTITRIRGEFQWYAHGDPGGPYPTPVGIRIGTKPPSGLTDDQIQEQANQEYADWMYYDRAMVTCGAAVGSRVSETALYRQPIDIKSQRRMDELQQSLYLFVGLGQTLIPNTNLYFNYNLNILLKMP